MRTISIVLLLASASCVTPAPDPHELVACDGWTINGGVPLPAGSRCEAACQPMPADTGPLCSTTFLNPCHSIDFDGIAGCCIPTTSEGPVKFFECQ